jgi:hypothetical protein
MKLIVSWFAVAACVFVAAAASAEDRPAAFHVPRAIAQPSPSLPAAFKQAHMGETVSGTYKICVATDGSIFDVTATQSIPDADRAIIDQIKKGWRFESTPVKMCIQRRFLFQITP